MENLAVVFTNTSGQIIFANHTFATMLQLASKGSSAWRHLSDVLGLPRQTMDELLEQAASHGELNEVALKVQTRNGAVLPVRGWGHASYDGAGKFTGIEMRLECEQIVEARSPHPDLSEADHLHLRNYFTQQMTVLRSLAGQIGGRQMQNNFDEIINSCARSHGWSVHSDEHGINASQEYDQAEAYSALMCKGVAYMVDAVGMNLVKRKLDQTDATVSDHAFAFVTRCGLRDLFLDY